MKTLEQRFPALNDHLIRMAGTGKSGTPAEWSAFVNCLHEAINSGDRDAVLEEAAQVCEGVTSWGLPPTKLAVAKSTQTFCAKAIRAQIGHTPEADDLAGGEAALAIGEHAFRAGFVEGYAWDRNPKQESRDDAMQRAWSDYDPPEDIKALA